MLITVRGPAPNGFDEMVWKANVGSGSGTPNSEAVSAKEGGVDSQQAKT